MAVSPQKGGGNPLKISVICPVLNEVDFIGYSIMAAIPFVHEFIYALDFKSDDGTRELLFHLWNKPECKDGVRHKINAGFDEKNTFHPSDQKAYNDSFNRCIAKMTGDVAFFLHPDMIITEGPKDGIPGNAMAWWTKITSYAGDMQTVITKGRTDQWKNLHAKKMGLHYFGGYGSANEDFYHSEITGRSYKHYGSEFFRYPFPVANSGIKINHYCENKDYARRLEKMKLCLKTLYPDFSEKRIEALALEHPRVTLEGSSQRFGQFEFSKSMEPIPEVFTKYKKEFESFKKEPVHA